MRALVITGPNRAEVQDVAPPEPSAGQVVVDVQRAGICGTDVEFFTGEMAYLHSGHAEYPIRIGHEWMGTVSAVGEGVDASWVGTGHGRHDAGMRRLPSLSPRSSPRSASSPPRPGSPERSRPTRRALSTPAP